MSNKHISHYKILNKIGSGGMAEVYKATDLNTKDQVALKILLPNLATDEIIRKRFLREAKIGMQLDHPSIVKVYEVREDRKRPFIAMEFVKGETLDQIMRSGSLDLERSIEIGLKVTDALSVAHAQGVFHRDLKPRNIMLVGGNAKVMDFGLARIVGESSLTEQHMIVGTLSYMSPEQAIGGEIDGRSDLFSLGVVLYEMLAGIRPFSGDNLGATLHAILYSDPLSIQELNKDIPDEVEKVILKALKKKQNRRYQTALEFRTDLEQLQALFQGKLVQLIAKKEVFEETPRGIYSKFIGRDKELESLEKCLSHALSGESTVLLLQGEAGIGKSRLAWELGNRAKEKGVRYMTARCLPKERGYAYQPIIEIIRDYFELKMIRDLEGVQDFLENKACHLATREGIVQTLLQMNPDKPVVLINKDQLWDTISELVKVMAKDRAIIMHLDDLHWADSLTLNLLVYLAMTTRQERILIIGSYRPEELVDEDSKSHPLNTTLASLQKGRLCEEMTLRRLGKEDTRHVIDSVLSHSKFADSFYDSIYRETEGNPLFVLEVLGYLRDVGTMVQESSGWRLASETTGMAIPDRLTDVITGRLRKIHRESRNILDVASVQGYDFNSEVICHVLGLSRLKVLRCLQDLELSHHLIHALERRYQFDHAMIQETVYNTLIPELKKEYHKLIANYYIERYRDSDQQAGTIAHNLMNADEEQESLPYLLKAGEYCRKLFAYNDALHYFNRGIESINKIPNDLTPELNNIRLSLFKYRADTQLSVGSYKEAKDSNEQHWRLVQEYGTPEEQASCLHVFARIYTGLADYKSALNNCDKAIRIQRKIKDRSGQVRILLDYGTIYFRLGDYKNSLKHLKKALNLARQTGHETAQSNALTNIGVVNLFLGNLDEALQYYEQAMDIAQRLKDKRGIASALANIGAVKESSGEYTQALRYFEQSLTIKMEMGDRSGAGDTISNIGLVQFEMGNFDKALEYYRKAIDIRTAIGAKWGLAATLNNIALLYHCTGDYEKALHYYNEALALNISIGNRTYEMYSRRYLLRFWLDIGDAARAHQQADSIRKLVKVLKSEFEDMWYEINLAHLKMKKGLHDSAMKHIRKGLAAAKRMDCLEAYIEGLLIAGKAELARANTAKAKNYVNDALQLATEKKRKCDMAQTYLLLAKINLNGNETKTAEENAVESKKISEACGTKEITWAAYYLLGEIHKKNKQHIKAKSEYQEAKKVLDVITSKLSKELRKIYLNKTEIRQFYKDLKRSTSRKK